jgi:hypothetical protein
MVHSAGTIFTAKAGIDKFEAAGFKHEHHPLFSLRIKNRLERGQKYTILFLVRKEPQSGFFVCQSEDYGEGRTPPFKKRKHQGIFLQGKQKEIGEITWQAN